MGYYPAQLGRLMVDREVLERADVNDWPPLFLIGRWPVGLVLAALGSRERVLFNSSWLTMFLLLSIFFLILLKDWSGRLSPLLVGLAASDGQQNGQQWATIDSNGQ